MFFFIGWDKLIELVKEKLLKQTCCSFPQLTKNCQRYLSRKTRLCVISLNKQQCGKVRLAELDGRRKKLLISLPHLLLNIDTYTHNTGSHNYLPVISDTILKFAKTSQEKMRSIVVRLFILLVAIVSIAVDGGNASGVSNKTPYRRDNRPVVICNTVQDSHCHEAIKTLEAGLVATLEQKFEQIMTTLNKTYGKVSLMFIYHNSFLFRHNISLFRFFLGRSAICLV